MTIIFDPNKPAEGTRFRSLEIQDNFNALSRANDLRPSQQIIPDLTVLVQGGRFLITNSAAMDYIGGSSPTLDTTTGGVVAQSRVGVLHVDALSVLSWKYGVWTVGIPSAPAYDNDKIALCEVAFTYNDTQITDSMIRDVRPFVNLGAGATILDPNEIQIEAQNITLGGQKDFDTSSAFEYTPGEHEILVWRGTDFQKSSGIAFDPTKDYQELDSTTVRFNTIIPAGEIVTIWRVGLAAPSFSLRDLSDVDGNQADGFLAADAPTAVNPFLTVSGHLVIDHSTIIPIPSMLSDIASLLNHGNNIGGTSPIALGSQPPFHDAADIRVTDNFSFSNATDVQGVLDDVEGAIYSKFLVEHKSNGEHGPKVTITQTSADNALVISKTNTSTGDVVTIANSGVGSALTLTQSNTSSSASALNIVNSAAGEAIAIVQSGEWSGININKTSTGSFAASKIQNAGTGSGTEITQSGNGKALDIIKTSTGNANAVHISNSGTGDGVRVQQVGDGNGTYILSTATGSSGRGLRIDYAGGNEVALFNKTGTSSANVITINNNASSATTLDIQGHNSNWSVNKSGNAQFNNATIGFPGTGAGLFTTSIGANPTVIASGVITATHSFMVVDTEGAAASDNLDTISGGVDGTFLTVMSFSDLRNVVLRTGGVGNLRLAANRTLDHNVDAILLLKRGGNWHEVSFSANSVT